MSEMSMAELGSSCPACVGAQRIQTLGARVEEQDGQPAECSNSRDESECEQHVHVLPFCFEQPAADATRSRTACGDLAATHW